MGAVAEGFVFGIFTLAEGHLFFGVDGEGDRREFGALMRPITKRLFLRFSTLAPLIGARFEFHDGGLLIGNGWFRHT